MGLYDTVVDKTKNIYIQVKSTECIMMNYEVGDQIPLEDGVHVGHEGVFTVKDGKVSAVYKQIIDKWGGTISPQEILEPHNPVGIAIKNIDEYKDT